MHKVEHEFAIHIPNLSEIALKAGKANKIVLKDKNLTHRLFSVLRFSDGDELVFFDNSKHAHVKIISWHKNGEIVLDILHVKDNITLTPTVTWLLPILKRTALEEALHSLCEVGINQIQLVITEKSQHSNLDAKHLERLNSIIISAAEQSKNFNYPEILAPIKLVDIEKKDFVLKDQKKIYFDPLGKSCLELLSNKGDKQGNLIAMCGPEADLTDSEKEFLKTMGFEFFALTKTVLRASQAVSIASGLLRLK